MTGELSHPISIRIEPGSQYFIVVPAGTSGDAMVRLKHDLDEWAERKPQFAIITSEFRLVRVNRSRFIRAGLIGWWRKIRRPLPPVPNEDPGEGMGEVG